jgi:ATP-dependent Clp protease ATP-binding subunit ClpX
LCSNLLLEKLLNNGDSTSNSNSIEQLNSEVNQSFSLSQLPKPKDLKQYLEEALLDILTQPRNALTKQYQELLRLDNVELEFEANALRAIASEAYRRKTGARALRGIIEELMLDLMYELPSQKNVSHCLITGKMVSEKYPHAEVLPDSTYMSKLAG